MHVLKFRNSNLDESYRNLQYIEASRTCSFADLVVCCFDSLVCHITTSFYINEVHLDNKQSNFNRIDKSTFN